jgi:hypothetical protein
MKNLDISTLTVGTIVVGGIGVVGISQEKLYVVEQVIGDQILLNNDLNRKRWYRSLHFIEADLYFSITLYLTLSRLLNLKS